MASITTISPAALNALLENDPQLAVIDVRTPAEYAGMHASFAALTPLDALDPAAIAQSTGASSGKTLYIFCRSGARAKVACEKFLAKGLEDVCLIEGGILAWEAAGLPVVRGQNAVSLDRQVRIAAGSLVLAGALLGYAVHPAFFALSGAVGAGLLYSGLTDSCAMGMLLSKMPWNQAR
ncbi:MAG: rhodanese-like domain-containing protein [Candidatus Hydrogenedentes bacterium]|nr:rhodanese-like domain-containing protein [Candidatus Hydrogenedentota bacterium]